MEITRKIILLVLVFSILQIIALPTVEVAAQSSLSNLTIVSPQNKIYNSKSLTLNATIDFVFARIESMSYSLDGLGSSSFSYHFPSEDSTIIHGTQIWLAALPELAEGLHSITVHLEGTLYFPEECPYSEQATVYFTVENTPSSHTPSPSPTPTPSPEPTFSPEPTMPTSPTPLPSEEPTPYEETGVQNTSQFMVAGGAVALVSIVVFLGLLAYFIKRK